MFRILRWVAIAAVAIVLLFAGVLFALHRWLATDDFRQRVEGEAATALGVPLKVGRLSVDVWPLPAVAVDKLQVGSQPPLTLDRVEVRPRWQPLLQGRLQIATLVVRDAVLPQQGITALMSAMNKKRQGGAKPVQPADGDAFAWVPRRMVLDRVTWVDTQGQRMTLDASADLDDAGLVDKASLKVLQGRFAGTQGKAEREADHWNVRVEIGGGSVRGTLKLDLLGGAARALTGNLDTQNVEVSALTAPSRTLSGKLEAQTQLRAEFKDPAQIADAMQTRTRFTVRNATVHGIDLAQAVKTVGLNRGGETRLDTLAGQVTTQGKTVHVTNLVASSGALAATGNVTIAPSKALNGRVDVQLTASKGTFGVPLAVGGTLDSPSVTLTRGALLGAAVGTLVAPGVGTGAGASVGDKLGDKLKGLFGR